MGNACYHEPEQAAGEMTVVRPVIQDPEPPRSPQAQHQPAAHPQPEHTEAKESHEQAQPSTAHPGEAPAPATEEQPKGMLAAVVEAVHDAAEAVQERVEQVVEAVQGKTEAPPQPPAEQEAPKAQEGAAKAQHAAVEAVAPTMAAASAAAQASMAVAFQAGRDIETVNFKGRDLGFAIGQAGAGCCGGSSAKGQVVVRKVEAKKQAEKLGVKKGWVLKAINSSAVTGVEQASKLLAEHSARLPEVNP